MRYVDGFVLPVPKKNLDAYRRLSRKVGKIWREHGALEYRECVGDDLKVKVGLPFGPRVKPRRGETIIFGWIGYRSRAHRERVNARIRNDPRMEALCPPDTLPFDVERMSWGGFQVLVDA